MREFVAKQRRIPGVKSNRSLTSWPVSQNSRPNPNNLTSNGGDFISARRQLITRYVLPWLLSLHDLDSELYTDILFGACLGSATEKDENTQTYLTVADNSSIVSCALTILHAALISLQMSSRCDNVLRFIMKLVDYGVVSSIRDALFLRWTDLALRLNVPEQVMQVWLDYDTGPET